MYRSYAESKFKIKSKNQSNIIPCSHVNNVGKTLKRYSLVQQPQVLT